MPTPALDAAVTYGEEHPFFNWTTAQPAVRRRRRSRHSAVPRVDVLSAVSGELGR